ncbi:MAG: AIR synthase-related protein [Planctomycetota bacterium]
MPALGQGRYAARGVSASKSEVHASVDRLDRGIFPGAFCKITEDYLTGDPDKCNVIHADGSGTKSALAYLAYRETGDPSVFRGIAQGSLVMNVDDLLCVGAVDGLLASSTVNRNARNFPGEALGQLIRGTEEFLATLRDCGVGIHGGGGETADVGDLTGTVSVDSCVTAVLRKSEVITGDRIRPGLAILGIASYGQASYETRENSGIGSNGLTSARHDLLAGTYARKYPETFDKRTPKDLVYCGPYRLEDPLPGSEQTVGEALLSPTRTYAPIVAKLLAEVPDKVRGLIHCSGGGQTKCLRFGRKVHFVKDDLLPIPPVFTAIQRASGTTWKEMYQVYNMGHRMEVYCGKRDAGKLLSIIRSFGVDARQIGHTGKSGRKDGGNHLTLMHGKRKLAYSL